jgi:hypothetical protein
MKKEARIQAEKMFLKVGGKITNREIATAVNVNALTVGRWKREDDWDSKLKTAEEVVAPEPPVFTVRKKAARDKALGLYLEAGGNITNKDLARKVGVSPATISKWKEVDDWISQITEAPEPEVAGEEEESVVTMVIPESVEAQETPESGQTEVNIGDLVWPEQIIEMNRKIDAMLKREYLTAGELAEVADAKVGLLHAVQTYLAIVKEVGEIQRVE